MPCRGERYADPFSGRMLDHEGCRALFTQTQGHAEFADAYSHPSAPRAIVARLLANLKGIYLARA